MKTTKKIIFIALIFFINLSISYSQEFKKNINDVDKIIISKLTNLSVEGYNGKEIIITSEDYKAPKAREDGLRPVFGRAQDNTGIGLYLKIKDGELKISPAMKEATNAKYKIKIPKNLILIIPKTNLFDMEFDEYSFASSTYTQAMELQEQMKLIAVEKAEIAEQVQKISEVAREAAREAIEQDIINDEIADQVEDMRKIAREENKKKSKRIKLRGTEYTDLDVDSDIDYDYEYDTDHDNDFYYIGPGVQIYTDEAKRQDLKFSNLEGEIEIFATNANIALDDITGPAVVYLNSGNIKANFSQLNQKFPVLFTTMNGEIDLSLPSNTKANLNITNLTNSQTFTDFDFDFDDDNNSYWEEFLGKKIKCQINGGGVEMELRATNGDVFIRKK